MTTEHLDVLIVGAGLSGIAAGYYLQTRCPTKRFAILEARTAMGGTWDLFRYPGVRSDSDMYTLGYSFRPWPEPQAIADGPAIRQYIETTAAEFGLDRHIRFEHRVVALAWSSSDNLWTVTVERGPNKQVGQLSCGFVYMCSGYYNYAQGYTPAWPGIEQFKGQIVHPQQWPNELAYANKRVVIIGSGATAVTLVPAMAATAAHVTMLQRSPSYIVAQPSQDAIANRLRRVLPPRFAHRLIRWKNVLLGLAFYKLARRRPVATKRLIIKRIRQQLGPAYDVETHFAPRYNPWDQRVCLVPDADLFRAINAGRASVVTDQIAAFTPSGIRLASGQTLDADLVVTATGLSLQLLSGIQPVVDGVAVDLSTTMTYKGMMFSDVPNLAFAMGYTNASWTLKCELSSAYVCRLLNFMDQHGYRRCTPRQTDRAVQTMPILDFTSSYVQRALASLPHQGSRRPWRLYQNYLLDLAIMRWSTINDRAMEFASAGAQAGSSPR